MAVLPDAKAIALYYDVLHLPDAIDVEMSKLQSVGNHYQTIVAPKSNHFEANTDLMLVLPYSGDLPL